MKPFTTGCMRYDGENFTILDQTLLPHQETWLPCHTVNDLVVIIQRLAIRGAPAIGISASVLLGLLAKQGATQTALIEAADELRKARPTAVNLMNNIDQMKRAIIDGPLPDAVIAEAEKLLQEDIELCERMSTNGAALCQPGDKLLTHCNTGSLATAGLGTALGVISKAHQVHSNIFVWVDETRPLLQGGRLTAWECNNRHIPHKIICDNMAAMLMAKGDVSRIFVGSDRIAANGDFANKIGTYSLAVLAHYHKVPFYVVAPQTTVDPECASGDAIPIELRGEHEVKGVSGSFGECQWAPAQSEVFNPAFDVTPAKLVTGWVLDTGVFNQDDVKQPNWWLG
ncbi:S-methyl-5-thioribose-1-phosphate isomerase [Pleionea litopenaei]|uniref:Methylthioribose-1-phosphate isomerase n=1 Tax=Pleionea litopenaei TaxID=3070815 RepID=A0AA51RWM3_9GAMM|nr:S-methyl-5-thioribose-1-phosphate isomerase [Pleionea sp. HL-JVS1]WMS88798.1 S-methyl-5-thioribose-1-phosphate isomerase [Pleionea sp. HL-JVS1]